MSEKNVIIHMILQVLRKTRNGVKWIMSKVLPAQWYVGLLYMHRFHKSIDLKQPKSINEKINWLKFHFDLTLPAQCADKYAVRDFVKGLGLGETLNELYGVYDKSIEIDYDMLPQQFVLKSTHGGGGRSVLIVRDKSVLDLRKVNKTIDSWLRQDDSYLKYEPHYRSIPHRVMVERLLSSCDGADELVDYKVHCCDGHPCSILVCSDRFANGHASLMTYDLQWNAHPEYVIPKKRSRDLVPRPQHLEQMIAYSTILSQRFPYVRVDWYETKEGLIFGELTFTPAGGFMNNYSSEYLLDLGSKVSCI